MLEQEQANLKSSQAKLQTDLKEKEKALSGLKSKYDSIQNELSQAEQKQTDLNTKISNLQKEIKAQQAAAKAREEALAKQARDAEAEKAAEAQAEKNAEAQAKKPAEASAGKTAGTKPAASASHSTPQGKSFYVTATSYNHEDTKSDITATGYNIKKNPNMKLIAVDPSVIPLGSKVWVEGYGVAIAADTGGAIKGHIIDVLMPNKKASIAWGRRTVKVIILN